MIKYYFQLSRSTFNLSLLRFYLASIIVLCTGNICRSPMAEAIFRKRFIELGREDIIVSSMGTHGLENHPASEYAVKVCSEHGMDITRHRSRSLVPKELKKSDLIFTMEPDQKEFVLMFFPQVCDRVFLLGAWPGKEKRNKIINDPIGGTIYDYRKTFGIIQNHIERIIPVLFARFPANFL